MNNHLLPPPYNQAESPSLLKRALVRPLCNALLPEPTCSTPQQPSTTPIPFGTDENGLPPIRVVCISDTHNATPPLPPGNILVHAGDLTAHGTFDELQVQLQWLLAQPHTHKIVITGNHDLILDEECDSKFLTRSEEDGATKRSKLDWSGLRYLQNEAVTLDIQCTTGDQDAVRRVKIYRSPLTAEFGHWAFQYPAIHDVWTKAVPGDTDILVVHSSPAFYGDCDSKKGPTGKPKIKGDGYLLREVRRVQPKLVICRHIHRAFGITHIKLNTMKEVRDTQQICWEGYSLSQISKALRSKVEVHSAHQLRQTLIVNTAFAPSAMSCNAKDTICVDLGL